MFLEGDELSALLKEEDSYIASLLLKWQIKELPQETEHKLRIGKRLELLGDLQSREEAHTNQETEKLKCLVKHMSIHSGYKDCGYSQMTSEQKCLYDQILKQGT
jgi:hypothetical protein